mmetsp:Transcript_138094/g.429245  ORF Transcript_138094/g.429245 Transcript_138094/m.429245 type:complete len:141 (+) Transcript_138094:100-522(+)
MPSPFPKMMWSTYEGGHAFDGKETVTVEVNGEPETVVMDPERGPKIRNWDGTTGYLKMQNPWGGGDYKCNWKNWKEMSSTEQEVFIHRAAKINKTRREVDEARRSGDCNALAEHEKVATPLRLQQQEATLNHYLRNAAGF